MPMPEPEMRRLIKRRLRGASDTDRIKLLRAALEELPGYYQGPYGQLRKWIKEEIERTRVRSRVVQKEEFAIAKDGDFQVALIGPPNAGKSSLLRALTGRQVAIGDYAFTTTRPVAATVNFNGARAQLVEIPGLVAGAGEGRGQGRALAAAARNADILCCLLPADAGPAQLWEGLCPELDALGLDPDLVILTRCDLVDTVPEFATRTAVPVSAHTGAGMDRLGQALWERSGLIRVWHHGRAGDPFVLPRGTTVAELAGRVHNELAGSLRYARVWGPSARFPGQRVGGGHVLADEDEVQLVAR
ncbi:MAG: GTPase [Bacillota bacterium]